MLKRYNLFRTQTETLDDQYFDQIRPRLYELQGNHSQSGSRAGRSLGEHLDSACQFVLTVSQLAQVPDAQRALILAATAVHDLNKLDPQGRKVKVLARDRPFLRQQLQALGVDIWVNSEVELELVRRLIERHSGHHSTDGMQFLPEDPQLKRWAALLVGGDLYDLNIPASQRIPKVETELTVALGRRTRLFSVGLTADRGYLTALLLTATRHVLETHGLVTLALNPQGFILLGEDFPPGDLMPAIAQQWQQTIDQVFSGNTTQLVRATKDGIKVDPQAVQQNPEGAIEAVDALLVKKFRGYKAPKVSQDIDKYSRDAGEAAVKLALSLGLKPVATDAEFAVSEGLKAAYLSYREAKLSPGEVWNRIAELTGLNPQQRSALEPFNAQYGRCLFAAPAITQGQKAIAPLLRDSFSQRPSAAVTVPPDLLAAAYQWLNLPHHRPSQGLTELTAYIEANPRQRCSLGTTSHPVEDLISAKMPPETKVQSFSNRLPGGLAADPKRQGDRLAALAYQLLTVGTNFPKATKQDPFYLQFALPSGSSPGLQRQWKRFLEETAQTHEEGPVTLDELQLYRDYTLSFKANKVVGMALPKKTDFVHATVIIPVFWGDVSYSLALLKSLRLGLEMALAWDVGFPFVLSSNPDITANWVTFGRVEGIPSSLQPLLGSGQYPRTGSLQQGDRPHDLTAEQLLERLRCLGKLAIAVASLPKKDDCLYDLARSLGRPLSLYHVLLRWLLREHDDPNLEAAWNRIKEPLTTLLEGLALADQDQVSTYLKRATQVAAGAKLWGNLSSRTAQVEPFANFIKALRSKKDHMDWDTVFAALVQQYDTRLHRIRGYRVSAKIKEFYDILREILEKVYHSRPNLLLNDSKTLEAAYLFFLQEARQTLKADNESDPDPSS